MMPLPGEELYGKSPYLIVFPGGPEVSPPPGGVFGKTG